MIIDSISSLHETPTSQRVQRRRSRIAVALGAAAAGVLLFGISTLQAQDPEALLSPVAIDSLADDDRTAVQGTVAEIFGNKFILTDPTGRALIETGRAGEGGNLVGVGDTISVQGRFHHGFMHAERLVQADGSVLELHPPHPPGKHGPHHGPHPESPAADHLAHDVIRTVARTP